MIENVDRSLLEVHGFELAPWQEDAVDAWARGDDRGPFRGTLEIFTGGGKTLIALAAAARAARDVPDLRVAIVVPTEALARQWRSVLLERTDLRASDVGLLGARRRDTFDGRRALVCVLASAAKRLPEIAIAGQPLVLIVDECHRAGAPKMARVLNTPAAFVLGLSATPDREELDDDGEPIDYDEHLLGQRLGKVVYRYSLRDARLVGWLPEYEISHHGVELTEPERRRYDELSRQVDDAAEKLERFGMDTMRARQLSGRSDAVGRSAQQYVAATSARKDLLYRAEERTRIAATVVLGAYERRGRPRVLLFHERVDEAQQLYERLRKVLPEGDVGIEHSKLTPRQRNAALDAFRSGETPVLVSVKSLIEGVDVPEADVGISVAASSSVRQRIQSLGRVLRRSPTEAAKTAEMHLVYVADTVDEVIYAREDWSDLTGTDVNRYWHWSIEPDEPAWPEEGPPRTPRPTEEQEWERLGRRAPVAPVPYEGALSGREYSVDTRGTVTNSSGGIVANPQGVGEMVAAVRGRAGGRFLVTPQYRMVLVTPGTGERGGGVAVAGVLIEPFSIRDLSAESTGIDAAPDVSKLSPGGPYPGPADAGGGEYKVSQRNRGVIQRAIRDPNRGRGVEFALTTDLVPPDLVQNVERLLGAWRELGTSGFKFSVNGIGHAWYLDQGEPRFLAEVPGGFRFPSEQAERGDTSDVDTQALPGEQSAISQEGGQISDQA